MGRPSVVVSQLIYGSCIGVPVAATHFALTAGLPAGAVVAGMALFGGVVALTLQRLWPYRTAWRAWDQDVAVDLLHSVFSTGAVVHVFAALTLGGFYWASAWLSGIIGSPLWPDVPIVLQLGLALVVGELGYYWVHRLAHVVPLFWRIHALHHSSERLHALASGRTHPLNAIAVYSGQFLPLALLGAPPDVLALLTVFSSTHGLLQHANVDLRLGWLNHVLAGPRLHRWHHSADRDASRSNFGSNLILWDQIFGTRRLPGSESYEVGLPGSDFRRNFLRHLASPFRDRVLAADPSDVGEDAVRELP